MKFVEPVYGYELEFIQVPRNKLAMSRYQRPLSTGLTNKLVNSIEHGFYTPLLVVNAEEMYVIVDGQHRLAALDKQTRDTDYSVPCIVLPERMLDLPLIYNIEKADNIKDKAVKVYNFYRDAVEDHPDDWVESQISNVVLNEPYVFDLAFGYCDKGLSSPSLVEPIAKKFQKFLGEPLTIAFETRRDRGEKLAGLESTINDLARESGITEFFVKKSMLSKCTMSIWGRKRKIDEEFDEGLQMILQQLHDINWVAWSS